MNVFGIHLGLLLLIVMSLYLGYSTIKTLYLQRMHQTYTLPVQNFAFSLLRAKGLSQQQTGKVHYSHIRGYKGQPKGVLKIHLVQEEIEVLHEERENIIRDFHVQYPLVELSIISNHSLTIEKIIEQRKQENKVIYMR